MIDGEQFEIDLGDKFQKFERIARKLVEDCRYSSGVSVKIYGDKPNVFWLGTRTNGPVETDYDYLYRIDLETAKYLLETIPGIEDWFDTVRKALDAA